MYEIEELSDLRNKVYGDCRFDERWLVNVPIDECFASVLKLLTIFVAGNGAQS